MQELKLRIFAIFAKPTKITGESLGNKSFAAGLRNSKSRWPIRSTAATSRAEQSQAGLAGEFLSPVLHQHLAALGTVPGRQVKGEVTAGVRRRSFRRAMWGKGTPEAMGRWVVNKICWSLCR